MADEAVSRAAVALRPTTADDLEQARGLFQDPGVYESWGGRPLTDDEILADYLGARSPEVRCFFVEAAGRVVGFAQCYSGEEGGPGGGGMDLVLLPAARGKGVGRAVVAEIVTLARDLGWRRLVVDPDVSNAAGVAFWQRVGFVPVRQVSDEPDREPYWLMEHADVGGDDAIARGERHA